MGDAPRVDDTLEIQRDDSPGFALACFRDGARTHDQDLGVLRMLPTMEKLGWIAYDAIDRAWWLTERGRATKVNLTKL